jgi:predicted TPR repeat methyltransferase
MTNFMMIIALTFPYSIEVYAQQKDVMKTFNAYADYFELYLTEGLDYSDVDKAYPTSNASEEVKAARSAMKNAIDIGCMESAKAARKESLVEIKKLLASQASLTDDQIISILDKQYHNHIDRLSKNYRDIVMTKLKKE